MYDQYTCRICLRRCGIKIKNAIIWTIACCLTALISKIIRTQLNLFPDAFRKFRMESREEKPSKSNLK